MKKLDKKVILNVIITIISFVATYSVQVIIKFEQRLTYSNSIISLVVFVAFIYLLKKTYIEENKSKIKNAYALGLLLSTFLVLGRKIRAYGEIDYSSIKLYIAIISLSFVTTSILVQIYRFIEKFEKREDKEEKCKLSEGKRQLIIFLIILVCWMPVYLASYPGNFCYDANDEFTQFSTRNLSAWHTAIHPAILGSIIIVVEKITHSYNIGIAAYIILQMIIVAGCFTYCILFLEKYKVSKLVRIISLLYYSLFPVIIMYATCSTKDTMFSAVLLLDIIVILEALLNKEEFIKSKSLQIKFIVATFLTIIFRNNAIYAYIPFLIIFMLVFKNKKIIIPIASIAVLYLLYMGPVYKILNVQEKEGVESFSVPLQQIARVYNYNFESLTQDELNRIYEYTTDDCLKQYLPKSSDYVKRDARIKQMGLGRFFKLWAEIGIKNLRNLCRFCSRKYIRLLVSKYNYGWVCVRRK